MGVFFQSFQVNKRFDGKKTNKKNPTKPSHFSEVLPPWSIPILSRAVDLDDPKGGCAFYVCLERKASLTLASDTRIINKDLNQTERQRLSNPILFPFFFSAY